MSGDKYTLHDQYSPYFLTFKIMKWTDIFTRPVYRHIIVDSLNYCVDAKGLEIYSWVIMSNHMHLACRATEEIGISGIIRDFKKFTSKRIVEAIRDEPESRREWLLDRFSFEARRTGRAENYKVWSDDNHAIYLDDIDIEQKINYIHENPVRAELVFEPEQFVYSSAVDYAGGKGLVPVTII